MSIAIAQPARTGNPGIVPPWLQGASGATGTAAATRDALVAVPLPDGRVVILEVPDGFLPGGHGHDHGHAPTGGPQRRSDAGAAGDARRGAIIAAEQRRIDDTVSTIQAKYGALGIRDHEGNDPVKAHFIPEFPNAAYAPEGVEELGLPADSIGVGIDPRSGRSFGEADDVIAHELAHRIIDHMTPQPLSMSPLSEDVAVHESLADTFASLVDQDGGWELGEELGEPVRIMDKPEQLGHPGHVADLKSILVPGGEHMVEIEVEDRRGNSKVVEAPDWHVVAGIPNKAAAIIGDTLGRDALGEIYIKAVREHVRPGQEIEGLAKGVLTATRDLFGAGSRELDVVTKAWDSVGVLDLLK